MKVSVIGTGKTGGAVADLLGDQAICFDSSSKITPEKIQQTDIAIIFVPGEAAEEISHIILKSEIPAVWGTTGYNWPKELPQQVKAADTKWVIGSNYSLGMNLVRKAINMFGTGSSLLKDTEYHIHEVHHVDKKDAPSGRLKDYQQFRETIPDVPLFSGDDGLMPFFATAGCAGLVSVASNVWPKETSRYVELCLNGAIESLFPVWKKAVEALFSAPNPIPAKILLNRKGIIETTELKLPLTVDEMKSTAHLLEADKAITN